jgi:hypothetical protein
MNYGFDVWTTRIEKKYYAVVVLDSPFLPFRSLQGSEETTENGRTRKPAKKESQEERTATKFG